MARAQVEIRTDDGICEGSGASFGVGGKSENAGLVNSRSSRLPGFYGDAISNPPPASPSGPCCPGEGAFVLKLAANGELRWVRTLSTISFIGLAALGDGGVILTAEPRDPQTEQSVGMFVTKIEGDATSAWSFQSAGTDVGSREVAAGASTFGVSGSSEAAADFDPGPGVDTIPTGSTFVSRFAD